MAHFYGTLHGARGLATRCGTANSGMRATVASWDGAVTSDMRAGQVTGETLVDVRAIPWHGKGVGTPLVLVRYNGDGSMVVDYPNGTSARYAIDGTVTHYSNGAHFPTNT